MADRERGERVQMMLSAQELAAIDAFRFKQHMPSRAAALREVLRRGLTVTGRVSTDGAQSGDFGVLKQRARKSSPRKGDILGS
jgi:hypothetical protein